MSKMIEGQDIDDEIDNDLGDLADGLSPDEPESDPDSDDEDEDDELSADSDEYEDSDSDEDMTDDEVPVAAKSTGKGKQRELSDDQELLLANGKKITLGDARKTLEVFEGSKDAKDMRNAYLRARDTMAQREKQYETERAPLMQTREAFEKMQNAYEADPVAFALQVFKLGAKDGVVDRDMMEAIQDVIEEYAAAGSYKPHELQAKAASRQSEYQAKQYADQERVRGFERELWSLQEENRRIFTEKERTLLVNAWNKLAITKGGRPTLKDAWGEVRRIQPSAKPVAKPAPSKVGQRRGRQTATTERAGGSGRNSGYSKTDLDKDLDSLSRF